MSAQRLSARSIRRIERDTGLDIKMAWAHGGYTMDFVTAEHRHGWWDKKDRTWGFFAPGDLLHYYPSCREWWPDDDDFDPNPLHREGTRPPVTTPIEEGPTP